MGKEEHKPMTTFSVSGYGLGYQIMQDYGKLHSIKKKIIGSGRNIRSCYLKDRSTNKKVYFL